MRYPRQKHEAKPIMRCERESDGHVFASDSLVVTDGTALSRPMITLICSMALALSVSVWSCTAAAASVVAVVAAWRMNEVAPSHMTFLVTVGDGKGDLKPVSANNRPQNVPFGDDSVAADKRVHPCRSHNLQWHMRCYNCHRVLRLQWLRSARSQSHLMQLGIFSMYLYVSVCSANRQALSCSTCCSSCCSLCVFGFRCLCILSILFTTLPLFCVSNVPAFALNVDGNCCWACRPCPCARP